jgi:hypothetical protein
MAPTKVIGMERRRPITDAAYALTMSSVSAEADRVSVGATRIPAKCSQHGADDPGVAGVGGGARPVERGERPVIDAGPHGDPYPGAVEEQAQPNGDDQGEDQDGHVVVGDPDEPRTKVSLLKSGGRAR